MAEEAKKAKNLASILENLASQEGSGISSFVTKTEGEEDVKYAYFMKDPNVNFRHEGIEVKSPEVVYLAATDDDTTVEELDTTEKVLVYCSASGSGKTVELAASSVTRDADLTFLLKIEGDVSMEDAKRAQKSDPKKRSLIANRNELAFEKLWENVEHSLFTKYDRAMTSILEGADADGLKIVVAIDEASSSPVLVRSIISDRDGAAAFLKQKIQGDTESKVLEILFSIAGTGVASQLIASDRGNFERMRTSAMRSPYLYPTMALQDTPIHLIFPGDTAAVLVTKDVGTPQGPLPMKKIANNAKRCDHGVLNGVFGERRLLFVSTPMRMTLLAAPGSKLTTDRKWLPRVMERCEILGDVMETLARQRCKDTIMATHTVQVNAMGQLVPSEA